MGRFFAQFIWEHLNLDKTRYLLEHKVTYFPTPVVLRERGDHAH